MPIDNSSVLNGTCCFCVGPITAKDYMFDGLPAVCTWRRRLGLLATCHLRCADTAALCEMTASWEQDRLGAMNRAVDGASRHTASLKSRIHQVVDSELALRVRPQATPRRVTVASALGTNSPAPITSITVTRGGEAVLGGQTSVAIAESKPVVVDNGEKEVETLRFDLLEVD